MSTKATLNRLMDRCIELAREAATTGNYALGALVAVGDEIITESGSSLIGNDNDPSAHPEMVVIREAARQINSRYLPETMLFTTLEPCPMCTSVAIWAKMYGIAFGATQEDVKNWVEESPHEIYTWRQINIRTRDVVSAGTPRLELYEGIRRSECAALFSLVADS